MEIKSGFYLRGFTRIDKGESGAFFVRYEEEAGEKGEPEIARSYLNYGGAERESYTLTVPKPKARKITACAIVTRTSKNSYTAACYDERQIATLKSDTLEGLRHAVAGFFEGVSA